MKVQNKDMKTSVYVLVYISKEYFKKHSESFVFLILNMLSLITDEIWLFLKRCPHFN